jgi:hypothetical protein
VCPNKVKKMVLRAILLPLEKQTPPMNVLLMGEQGYS